MSCENFSNKSGQFLKNYVAPIVGVTFTIGLIDFLIKLGTDFHEYHKNTTITPGDGADIGVAIGVTFIGLLLCLGIKHCVERKDKNIDEESAFLENKYFLGGSINFFKQTAKRDLFPAFASTTFFSAIDACIKYFSDFHHTKSKPTITKSEWIDVGITGSLIFIACIMLECIKNYGNGAYSREEKPEIRKYTL